MSSINPSHQLSNLSLTELSGQQPVPSSLPLLALATTRDSVSQASPGMLVSSPSSSSSSTSTHSDQFEDAPEEAASTTTTTTTTTTSHRDHHALINPLEALAMACVAEKGGPTTGTKTPGFQISKNDVLCGRGGLTNHHPGNVFFRRLVRIKQEAYLLASKREKAGVAKEIVELIRNLSPPGRFLKKDPQNPGMWMEIGDRKAREKTSQALREGAPELREELQSAEQQQPSDPIVMPPSVESSSQQQQQQTLSAGNSNSSMHGSFLSPVSQPTHEPQETQPSSQPQHPLLRPQQTLTADSVLSSPRKPRTVASNRARVVSDDAGLFGLRPLFHSIEGEQPHVVMDDSSSPPSSVLRFQPRFLPAHLHPLAIISQQPTVIPAATQPAESGKRKADDECQGQPTAKRGPRLKLLKSRLQNSGSQSSFN